MAGRVGRGSEGKGLILAAAILGSGATLVNVKLYRQPDRPAACWPHRGGAVFGNALASCFDFAGLCVTRELLHSTMAGPGRLIGALCLSAVS